MYSTFRKYEESSDTWICPNGQKLTFHRESKGKTDSGYETRLRYYRCATCEECPFKEKCTKAAGNKELRVSLAYHRYKEQAKEQLWSEEGNRF
jgi:hypothetical protein